MQISASNLLIAGQQTQAPAQQPTATASFAAALRAGSTATKADFEPLRAEAPAPGALAGDAKPAVSAQATGPGANLDIRV